MSFTEFKLKFSFSWLCPWTLQECLRILPRLPIPSFNCFTFCRCPFVFEIDLSSMQISWHFWLTSCTLAYSSFELEESKLNINHPLNVPIPGICMSSFYFIFTLNRINAAKVKSPGFSYYFFVPCTEYFCEKSKPSHH